MLSLKRYSWLCVLGAEVAYFVCLLGAYLPFRTVKAAELHRTLLETLPGFAWGSAWGVLTGALDIFVVAWVFGAYFVWMHNTSIVRGNDAAARDSEGMSAVEAHPAPAH